MIYRIFILIILFFVSFNGFCNVNNKNTQKLKIELDKCKKISKRKFLEFSIEDADIILLENDILANSMRICGKKIGKSEVTMLMSDGIGQLTLEIEVHSKKISKAIRKKNEPKVRKSSKFDKDLKNRYIISGWK